MSEILNENYKKVKEYDLTCPYCGCLARYKDYELSRYEDCYDTPTICYQCANCIKYVSFPEAYLGKYDSYEFNQGKSKSIENTIIKADKSFYKFTGILEPIFYIVVLGIIFLLYYICKIIF